MFMSFKIVFPIWYSLFIDQLITFLSFRVLSSAYKASPPLPSRFYWQAFGMNIKWNDRIEMWLRGEYAPRVFTRAELYQAVNDREKV